MLATLPIVELIRLLCLGKLAILTGDGLDLRAADLLFCGLEVDAVDGLFTFTFTSALLLPDPSDAVLFAFFRGDDALRFKNFDLLGFSSAVDSASRTFAPLFGFTFDSRVIFDAIRLARRRQLYFSLLGTFAHISPNRRDIAEKSISGFVFSISCRTSFDHIMYAVYRLLPLSFRNLFFGVFSVIYALFRTVVSMVRISSSSSASWISEMWKLWLSMWTVCGVSSDNNWGAWTSFITRSGSTFTFIAAGDVKHLNELADMAGGKLMLLSDMSIAVNGLLIILVGVDLGVDTLLMPRAVSISSGDWKSVNFDDFFRTRPHRETPVTSKSKTYGKMFRLFQCHWFSRLDWFQRRPSITFCICMRWRIHLKWKIRNKQKNSLKLFCFYLWMLWIQCQFLSNKCQCTTQILGWSWPCLMHSAWSWLCKNVLLLCSFDNQSASVIAHTKTDNIKQ